jgi:two-component system sensor histidine kinase BarA
MTSGSRRRDTGISIETTMMATIIVAFIIFISIACGTAYLNAHQQLESEFAEDLVQTESALDSSVTLVGRGLAVFDSFYDVQMYETLTKFSDLYDEAGADPAAVDIHAIRDRLDPAIDGDLSLYIISGDHVIIASTEPSELGINFSLYGGFSRRLDMIREGGAFAADAWIPGIVNPELRRKFAYLPSSDGEYILEAGISNDLFFEPRMEYFSYSEAADTIRDVNTDVESIIIFDITGDAIGMNESETVTWATGLGYENLSVMLEEVDATFAKRAVHEVMIPDNDLLLRLIYIENDSDAVSSDELSVVAAVVYSLEKYHAEETGLLLRYVLLTALALLFAGIVAYFISRRVAGPVRMISEDVDAIAQGDLNHAIRETEGRELERLETSIRAMVSRLKADIRQIQDTSDALDVELGERKRIEAALLEANARISLLGSLTRHDIINQLTIVQMYVELIREEIAGDERAGAVLAPSLSHMEDALIKIERQLHFSADYHKMGQKEPLWQNIADTATKAVVALMNHQVTFDIRGSGFEVLADPMFEQVFYNLFENSLRHGGSVSCIQVDAVPVEDGFLKISILDDGSGIAAEEKSRIFEKGIGKNTGFGLFLVREILNITGITISETGTPGGGARFELLVSPGGWRQDDGS